MKWTITEEAKARFALFIENRNEIIHFGKLTNLTFACSHSLYVLLNLCPSLPALYPKFASLEGRLKDKIDLYNILVVEILYATEVPKVLEKVKDNAELVKQTFTSLMK